MAPKKNKKPKLTKAERKALKALKKKLALIQIKKDKMDREHKMVMANLPKVVDKYYPLMKEATISRMTHDLKVMEQISKRVLDLKHHTIQTLQEDIESAEITYMRLTRTHLSRLDQLIGIMQARIKGLSDIYDIEREYRLEHAKDNKERLKKTFEYEEEKWKVVINLKSQEHKEREANAIGEFYLKIEDMIDRLQTRHDKMEGYFESSLIKMWESMQNYFNDYQQRIEERRRAYDRLLHLDKDNSACIKRQAHRIHFMTNQVQILTDELKIGEKKYKREIGDLKAERAEYISVYQNLRTGLSQDKSGDSTILKDLVSCTHQVEKKLGKTKEKAAKILTLAQMCRALETEEEKILLPKTLKNDDINRKQIQRTQLTDLDINEKIRSDKDRRGAKDSQKEQFFADIKNLQGFWARVGRANMLRGELGLKKQFLMDENEMLKDKLREFMLMLGKQSYCGCEIDKLMANVHVPTHD